MARQTTPPAVPVAPPGRTYAMFIGAGPLKVLEGDGHGGYLETILQHGDLIHLPAREIDAWGGTAPPEWAYADGSTTQPAAVPAPPAEGEVSA